MTIKELVLKEQKLIHNIWRIKSEISKNDRPDLLQARKTNLKAKDPKIIIIVIVNNKTFLGYFKIILEYRLFNI
jgi:hypothetical protein